MARNDTVFRPSATFFRSLCGLVIVASLIGAHPPVIAQGVTYPVSDPIDMTPANPLTNPSGAQPRYISGFGLDDTLTLFYEDRATGSPAIIYYDQTTSGPTGFVAVGTQTNLVDSGGNLIGPLRDTHFEVKPWPITIGGTTYAYRAWGAVGNNPQHNFYVSSDMINWRLIATFTIPNAPGFTDARGFVFYGFHDVIRINGTYYAWGESNGGQTMMVRSVNGDDVWEAFDSVGGTDPDDGPLYLRPPDGSGPTPTGNFLDLGYDRGYGIVRVPGDDSALYLAINPAACPSLPPDELEAAFINPDNWTWHDGTTGAPATPISPASAHDWREVWVVPQSDPDAPWVILYTATWNNGVRGLGYMTVTPPAGPAPTPEAPEPPPPITEFSDPAISKVGSPGHAAVGEPITWTIEVWNPGSHPTRNFVFVRDFVPDAFDIVAVTATRGVVTTEGREVHVAIGMLQPGDRVTVTIETMANSRATAGDICNTASADWNYAFTDAACVTLYPAMLPQTGAARPGRFLWAAAALLVGGLCGAGWALVRRRKRM